MRKWEDIDLEVILDGDFQDIIITSTPPDDDEEMDADWED